MMKETEEVVYPPLVRIPRPKSRINTSNHRHLTFQGKTATLREWAILLGEGSDPHFLKDRLYRYGWSVVSAL
jgi:hypothetical protein